MPMRRPSIVPLSLVTLALFIAALACGPAGGGAAPTNPPPSVPTAKSGGETLGAGAVSSLEDVRNATIRIQAEGSYADLQQGPVANVAWQGSGFIIDPSGLAVTNNHVVTGAALLKVWVEGYADPLNARVLGVSECSDLAVIDIEGDGYPYLNWREDPIKVGLDVYGAGFPTFGNTEYTLTKGIVSKEKANGDRSWSSVESVLETDVRINPGNSGGPLVDGDGHVLGVNFAGNNLDQYFAIAREAAIPVVEELETGKNVDSIGVNGQAFVTDDGSLAGIWVASVASGSPADQAGLRAGDVITTMEGLTMGADGTMADYCDVLRSHQASDKLAIEVLRFDTGEVLTGQLNGDPLVTSFSFSTDVGTDTGTAGEAYSEYTAWTDSLGAIQVEVPTSWTDVDGTPFTSDNGADWAAIGASPNLDDFNGSWGTPGVKFNATADKEKVGGHLQMLDQSRSAAFLQDCTLDQRYDYNDGVYRGAFDYYKRCGGTTTDYMILSAVPIQSGTNVLIFVEIQIVNQADLDAADRILATFDIVGNLP